MKKEKTEKIDTPVPKKQELPEPAFSLTLSTIGGLMFAAFAAQTSDWSILVMAGISVFLLFYPLIRYRSNLEKRSLKIQLLALFVICCLTCIVLNFLVSNPEQYPTIVTLMMAALGVKLVFYPIYISD